MNFNPPSTKGEIFSTEQKLRALRKDVSKLEGLRESLIQQEKELTEKVGKAKGRLLLKPKVDSFLEDMQNELHQRAVGTYETLLTAIAADVLDSDKPIGLDLYTERGLPALDIFIDAGNDNKEDIVNGAGGSMTNVISLGLRMIATVKSGMRKFVALDEPDCWVSPKRVPSFYNVINGLSSKLKLQSFVISHHSMELLPDDFSIVELKKNEHGEVICISDPEKYIWEDNQIGIRRIKLINFMSHKNTEVFLHPGVTAIIGENHLGKSVFIRALRALCYGESSDSDISHGEKKLEVEIEIEHGKVVRFTREKKRNPINEWTLEDTKGNILYNNTTNTEYKTGGRAVPDWVLEQLKIDKFEGFDHQLSHQKFPVFLLGEGPSKRASVLAIGKESGYIQEMIVSHKEKCKEDASLIREGEKSIYEIQDKLKKLEDVNNVTSLLQQKEDELFLIKNDIEASDNIKTLLDKLELYAGKILERKPIIAALVNLPDSVPNYSNMLKEEEDLLNLGKRIKTLGSTIKNKYSILEILQEMPEQEIQVDNLDPLQDTINQLMDIKMRLDDKKNRNNEVNKELADIELTLNQQIEDMGGLCPLCGNGIENAEELIKGH